MNILGIDYGTKKIGLAIANTDTNIVMPLKTIFVDRITQRSTLQTLIKNYRIEHIVCGLPSSSKTTSQRIMKFVKTLTKGNVVSVSFVDENLSSVHAKSVLSSLRQDHNLKIKKYGTKDTMSAFLILEQWLSEHNTIKN